MGAAGVRAVALCDRQVIEMLNRSFVAVHADELDRDDGVWRDLCRDAEPSTRVLMRRLRRLYRKMPRLLQGFVIAPCGDIVAAQNLMVRTEIPQHLLSMLAQYQPKRSAAAKGRVAPRTPVARDGGLRLRVVARYVRPPSLDELNNLNLDKAAQSNMLGRIRGRMCLHFVYLPAFAHASRDWVTLTPQSASQLRPPLHSKVGTAYRIAGGVAEEILLHFCAQSAPIYLHSTLLRSASLSGLVAAKSGQSVTVMLRGAVRMSSPGLDGLTASVTSENWIEELVTGYLQCRGDCITDVRMVTQYAADCTPPGQRLQFRVAMYQVAPANGCRSAAALATSLPVRE